MNENKLPQAKKKQKINPVGLSELAKRVRDILKEENDHAQKEMRDGDNNSPKFSYFS